MNKNQLFRLTSYNFELPHYIYENKVKLKPAHNIPIIRWPNSRWFTSGNIWMLELYERNLSRSGRGGTLAVYAHALTHLMRFVVRNNLSIGLLSDNDFCAFVEHLKHSEAPSTRTVNHIRSVCYQCLDFLECYGRTYLIQNFLGRNGQIKAHQAKSKRGTSRADFVKVVWHHNAIPLADPYRTRNPISAESISQLTKAVGDISPTIYIRKRRYVMLRLLEITGGRRSELCALTVQSVYAAGLMESPSLEVLTLKQGGNVQGSRLIPISHNDLKYLLEYIRITRRRVIKNTCGESHDCGFFFISTTTGQGIRPNTITQEIYALRKHSKIAEQACAHMFRHRFITKLFVAIIERHGSENLEDLKYSLLNIESFKIKLQQWTGHRSAKSLDTYIHLAFDEALHLRSLYRPIALTNAVYSIKATLELAKQEARRAPSSELIETIIAALDGFEADIRQAEATT